MPKPGELRITVGALSAGCEWPALKLAVLTEGQLTAPTQKKLKLKKDSNRQKLQSYTDLSPGDLVVHVHHGIGRFVGIQRMPVDGVEKDYIKIDYAGGDCLYVPVTQLDLVSKYIGGGEDTERTKLNKLGGAEWTRQKTKAKKAAKDLARGLIALYAERQKRPGFAFSPDSPWQQEFEDAFDYTETDDQLQAIREIKADMEKPVPMDRLLCGDVGYGKTEVALRAAFKAVQDSKQVVYLVPTTILAQQHYETFFERFAPFGLEVEVLSRFRTPAQQKRALKAFAEGTIDVLIGTQMIVKGHDFPKVTLVGILAADLSLNASDYRAGERTFQLLTQAVGRAGRGVLPGEAVIQTYQPDHYAITCAAAQDYKSFYEEEILYRELSGYPPAAHMLAVQIYGKEEENVKQLARRLTDVVKSNMDFLQILGPTPANISKINDIYRYVFYAKHAEYDTLVAVKDCVEETLRQWQPRQLSIQFDFDPVNVL